MNRARTLWAFRVAGLLLIVLCGGMVLSPATSPYQSPGTKRMAAKLVEIWNAQAWDSDPFKNRPRVDYLRNWLRQNQGDPREWSMHLSLANQLLELGESAQAVDELENTRKLAREKGALSSNLEAALHDLLGIAYLRLGEQENCLHNHNADSCLFPIQGGGVHTTARGAEGAIREFTAILENKPADLNARWLLNIAYMALGKHPKEVPGRWLIPSSTFDSEYDIKRFRDVAPNVGLDITGHSGGSIAEDFDGDGFIDLMVSSSGPMDQLRFFHNNGNGTFTERTNEAGLLGEVGGLNMIHADYNNDGHPDVLVLRGGWFRNHGEYPMSLLRNNGNGTFDDVTEDAGVMALHPTQTGAWADYDTDGFLDLFVGRGISGRIAPFLAVP
jgi:FG-GAP-like repeat